MICWMDEQPMTLTKQYIVKHTTRYVKAHITKINYRVDVDTLHRQPVEEFQLNDIGRIEINTLSPIF